MTKEDYKNLILRLESMLITDNYNLNYIKKIIFLIRDNLDAEDCIWYKSVFNNSYINTNDKLNLENIKDKNIITLWLDDIREEERFLIINPRYNLDKKILDILTIYLNNISKLATMIASYKNKISMNRKTSTQDNKSLINLMKNNDNFFNIGVASISINDTIISDETDNQQEKLLITVSESIKKLIPNHYIYHKNKEEFIIIYPGVERDFFISKLALIKAKVKLSGYSISIGYTYYNNTNNISALIKESERNMNIKIENYILSNASKNKVKKKSE